MTSAPTSSQMLRARPSTRRSKPGGETRACVATDSISTAYVAGARGLTCRQRVRRPGGCPQARFAAGQPVGEDAVDARDVVVVDAHEARCVAAHRADLRLLRSALGTAAVTVERYRARCFASAAHEAWRPTAAASGG